MKAIQSTLLSCTLILSLGQYCAAETDTPDSSIQKFNQAAESWKQLQEELDALPAGHLRQATHLVAYTERLHGILMEIHDATANLPVSETTKVCLDYALHKKFDVCACTAECCQQANAENREVSPEEMDAMVVEEQKHACKCTLPIRLAIRHDLINVGVSDQETLDMILMIPEGTKYRGLPAIDWKNFTAKKPRE